MELNTFDRVILLNILPKEGDITTIRVIRELREGLSFSEDEHKRLQFKTGDNGLIQWRTDEDMPKDVLIGSKANQIITERLNELNKQKKLTEEHLSLWERFCE